MTTHLDTTIPPQRTERRRRRPADVPAIPEPRPRTDLGPLPGEADLWAAAPLRDGIREMFAWPMPVRTQLVVHYRSYVHAQLRRHQSAFAYHVPDPDDRVGYADLWLIEAIRHYDPARGVCFAGFLLVWLAARVRDLERYGGSQMYGARSELALSRLTARFEQEHGREPTLTELVAALGAHFDESLAEATDRLHAVTIRKGLRQTDDLDTVGVDQFALTADGGVYSVRSNPEESADAPDRELLAAELAHEISRALINAAQEPDETVTAPGAIGLWTAYLETYHKVSRRELARRGQIRLKTITAATRHLYDRARDELRARGIA